MPLLRTMTLLLALAVWSLTGGLAAATDTPTPTPMFTIPTITFTPPTLPTIETPTPEPTPTPTRTPVPVVRDFYVNQHSQGPEFLGTRQWPYLTINEALARADDQDRIFITGGTYAEQLVLNDGRLTQVEIRGGYSPQDWNVRDPIGSPTILEPGNSQAISISDLFGWTIDGFTIRNGRRGINVANSGGTLQNIIIRNCTDTNGGAIQLRNSSPVIRNCLFVGNSASNDGGAIFCFSNSGPLIANNTFVDNRVTSGVSPGACISMSQNSRPEIRDNIFFYESVTPSGTTLKQVDPASAPTVSHNTFWPDTVSHFGLAAGNLEGIAGNTVENPLFLTGAFGDYYLSQPITGSAVPKSPCVDSGSRPASEDNMNSFTTRLDGVGDLGVLDRGYHAFDVTMAGVPSGLVVVPGELFVTLRWTAVTDEDLYGYEVFLSTNFGNDPVPITRNQAGDYNLPYLGTAMQVTGLSRDRQYVFYVQAVDFAGNRSQISNQVLVRTNNSVPDYQGLVSTFPGNQEVRLQWTSNPTANSYNIYRSLEPDNGYKLLAQNYQDTSYFDRPLTNEVTYYYRVSGVNNAGESRWSSVADAVPRFFTPTPTGTPTPSSTPTETPTDTPTETPTSTPSHTPDPADPIAIEIWADFITQLRLHTVEMRVYNISEVEYPVVIYVAVEIAGTFYFYPSFSTAPEVLAAFTLPGIIETGRFPLFSLAFPDPIEPPLTVTWYAAMLDSRDYSLLGTLASSSVTLN